VQPPKTAVADEKIILKISRKTLWQGGIHPPPLPPSLSLVRLRVAVREIRHLCAIDRVFNYIKELSFIQTFFPLQVTLLKATISTHMLIAPLVMR